MAAPDEMEGRRGAVIRPFHDVVSIAGGDEIEIGCLDEMKIEATIDVLELVHLMSLYTYSCLSSSRHFFSYGWSILLLQVS
jgi:hypothetical protein